jgi:galactoside O-acetyltransferase
MDHGFYNVEDLNMMGFKSIGENVKISKFCSIYQPYLIEIGNNVRIDDFCKLNGKIKIGSCIHIASYTCLMGSMGIEICDFVQISIKSLLLSATDDFSGEYLVGPQAPLKYRKITGGKIILEKHAAIGANSMIMPGITMKCGSVLGAYSFLTRDTKPWMIYWGIPARALKERQREIANKEHFFVTV